MRASLALFAALAVSGPARAEGPTFIPGVDQVVVRKSDRTMVLHTRGHPIHTISGIQLGREPDGPKRFEGDGRTPEGRYAIGPVNRQSAYHLSLRITYPNEADAARAAAQGRKPGGDIFIHGQPNGSTARVAGDWTDGCIAVSDAEIELLVASLPEGTPIEITP